MIQSGGILGELLLGLPYELLKKGTKELIKRTPKINWDATRHIVNKGINKLLKKITLSKGSRITLKVYGIMKVIKSLGNRGILLKGTTTKITNKEGWFLNFLSSLMAARLPLMKSESVLTSLAKSIMLEFGLSAATSATDAAIQENIYGSGITALIISNKETEDIMKIVKSLKESGLLIKGISERIKNEAKEQKERLFPMILVKLAAILLGCALAGIGVITAGEGVIRTGQNV